MEYVIIGLLIVILIISVVSLTKNINESNITERLGKLETEVVKELGIFRRFKIEKENVKTFENMWTNQGVAWFCEISDTEIIGKTEFKIINAYYGSSSFNSKQMSRLINDLVEDCKVYGIEIKTQSEINSLLESWDKK